VTEPRIGAFFDIDHTVLEINSGTKWVGYMWKTGQMSPWELVRAAGWSVQYRFGLLDFESMARRVIAQYEGKDEAPIREEVEQWFQREIAWAICTQAREAIAAHREQGHVIALLTSATRYLSQQVAVALEIEHVLCTEVEVADGRFTGRYEPPACYGPGKVTRAEDFASAQGLDLDASFFYSDSYSDLPMLQRVGEPRVVNPDPRLRRFAARQRWSVETWTAPPRADADEKVGQSE
jgi:HAD superfamily hydrolase (TIGR01490 family)